MSQIQSLSRQSCVLLAVLCGKHADKRTPPGRSGPEAKRLRPSYPFPELSSAGRLEVSQCSRSHLVLGDGFACELTEGSFWDAGAHAVQSYT